jgi:hypothetical protein
MPRPSKNAVSAEQETAATSTSSSRQSVTTDAITFTQAELQETIDDCVRVALKKATAIFNAKLDEQRRIIEKQEIVVKEQGLHITDLHRKVEALEIENNRLEQYSRRSHLRIHGLQIPEGKDTRAAVVEFCNEHLKDIELHARDIEVAHPLPLTTKQERAKRPKAIIVRFFAREVRDTVIKAQRSLKDSGITITEDLTRKNTELLQKLKASKKFANVWSWNGRICATRTKGDPITTFDINDQF